MAAKLRSLKESSSMEMISAAPAKKTHKLTKKDLKVELIAISEEIISSTLKEYEISPVSEVVDGVLSTEGFKDLQDPDVSESSEKLASSKVTLSVEEDVVVDRLEQALSQKSEVTPSVEAEVVVERLEQALCQKSRVTPSVEAEVVVDRLEQALCQILNAADVDPQSKKLVKAMFNIVMEDLRGVPEERDLLSEQLTARYGIMLCHFLMWIILVTVILFINSGVGSSSFSEPRPT